ncbi:MAG TPA: DUF4127 family protein [Pyrinomonadaceae bacterium]|nr:DUF4127 family protein [Pyrinomonadaceae bacterium]
MANLRTRFISICFFSLCLSTLVAGQAITGGRILLIPMDDRPPCLQFPVRMGMIGDATIVTPPKDLLGRFTTPGQSDRIISWLKAQNMRSFDAAIVSLDMVAYGGLVAMRRHGDTSVSQALARLDVLRELKQKNPRLPIYVQSVIMRLAPTGDGKNESYRDKLSQWAELSPYPESSASTTRLEREIPADVLDDYKRARKRDLEVNLKAIELVRDRVIDYLILSQDDAKPKGIHVADRESLLFETNRLGLRNKIAIQPGADEVAMLLLARALNKKFKTSPRIKAIYSSAQLKNKVMPYEDRALSETVSFHIKATGSREVESEKDADILFYVYASRYEPGRAISFADEIDNKIEQGSRVIVADIDPKGDVQGGDLSFTRELERRALLAELNSYASWNTAGNTIGTTLPQGVIFALATAKLMRSKDASDRIWTAQNWFTFHRVLDDYYYHNEVRAKAREFILKNKWTTVRLSDEATRTVEDFSSSLMLTAFESLSRSYFALRKTSRQRNVRCEGPRKMSFDLPWNRTFEAEIDFDLKCWRFRERLADPRGTHGSKR